MKRRGRGGLKTTTQCHGGMRCPDWCQSSSNRRQYARAAHSRSVRGRPWLYVDPGLALTTERHSKAIRLEFEVEGKKATVAKLEAIGIRTFEYFDKAHKCFQAPGGQAFRLAQL
jgi:hypothetical protein